MVNVFMAALKYLLEQQKRGAQVRLAEALEITPKYVNDIVKGRRTPGQDLQEKIAAFYGIRYEDFISFGRHILAGYDPKKFNLEPPRFISPLPQTLEERMPEEFSDELEMVKKAQKNQKHNMVESNISDQIKLFIVSVNGYSEAKVINHVVPKLPARDSIYLRKVYKACAPDVRIATDFTCPACEFEQELEVPFGADFFWPE